MWYVISQLNIRTYWDKCTFKLLLVADIAKSFWRLVCNMFCCPRGNKFTTSKGKVFSLRPDVFLAEMEREKSVKQPRIACGADGESSVKKLSEKNNYAREEWKGERTGLTPVPQLTSGHWETELNPDVQQNEHSFVATEASLNPFLMLLCMVVLSLTGKKEGLLQDIVLASSFIGIPTVVCCFGQLLGWSLVVNTTARIQRQTSHDSLAVL